MRTTTRTLRRSASAAATGFQLRNVTTAQARARLNDAARCLCELAKELASLRVAEARSPESDRKPSTPGAEIFELLESWRCDGGPIQEAIDQLRDAAQATDATLCLEWRLRRSQSLCNNLSRRLATV